VPGRGLEHAIVARLQARAWNAQLKRLERPAKISSHAITGMRAAPVVGPMNQSAAPGRPALLQVEFPCADLSFF
jgi:hypothetical protein